jgi:hypothetical protein
MMATPSPSGGGGVEVRLANSSIFLSGDPKQRRGMKMRAPLVSQRAYFPGMIR